MSERAQGDGARFALRRAVVPAELPVGALGSIGEGPRPELSPTSCSLGSIGEGPGPELSPTSCSPTLGLETVCAVC